MSPENAHKHGAPKVAIAAGLYDLVVRTDRGTVLVDCTRIVSVDAQLSVEPDVLAILWDSIENGRVRQIPAASGEPGSVVEFEGAPDLVVEVISDSSVGKDRHRLPPLYAKAGVPELWLVDARRKRRPANHAMEFAIYHLGPEGYVLATPDAEGWCESRVLGRRCRLRRRKVRDLGFAYELELAPLIPAHGKKTNPAARRRAR